MAAVAFLHQAEYERALNEYADETRRQEEGLLVRGGSGDMPRHNESRAAAKGEDGAAAARRRQHLQRGALKHAGGGKGGARDKSAAISSWLQGANGPSSIQSAFPLQAGPAVAGAGSATRKPVLRRSTSFIAKRSLAHRATDLNLISLMDRLLPVLHPETLWRRCWDLFIQVLVVYTAITVPLEVSYGMPKVVALDALGYAMDACFVVDLVLNFRTAYFDHQGELVRDSGAIARNYLKFWFWIDIFGTIPFDSIVVWSHALSESATNDGTLAALGFLKAPRMLRLGRLLRFLDRMKNGKMVRIAQLFAAMCLISHWLACVWYLMYRFGGKDAAEEWSFNVHDTGAGEAPALSAYIINYYQSFLLLVGDNINAYNNYERTFMVVVLIGGTFFYSAVVGQMAALVATMNVAVNRHGQKLLMVQDALRYAGVPDYFCEKVHFYFEYLQTRSHPGSEGMAFLQELPSSLYLQLHLFLHKRSLEKVSLFKDCDPGFISAVAARVKMISLSPKEIIFRIGDVGNDMYIIKKGCVVVTTRRREVLSLLTPGEIFGEVALLSTGKRTATCTALGFVDLALLSGHDLQAVMRDYPTSAAMVRERAAARAQVLSNPKKAKVWLELSDDEEEGQAVDDEEEDVFEDAVDSPAGSRSSSLTSDSEPGDKPPGSDSSGGAGTGNKAAGSRPGSASASLQGDGGAGAGAGGIKRGSSDGPAGQLADRGGGDGSQLPGAPQSSMLYHHQHSQSSNGASRAPSRSPSSRRWSSLAAGAPPPHAAASIDPLLNGRIRRASEQPVHRNSFATGQQGASDLQEPRQQRRSLAFWADMTEGQLADKVEAGDIEWVRSYRRSSTQMGSDATGNVHRLDGDLPSLDGTALAAPRAARMRRRSSAASSLGRGGHALARQRSRVLSANEEQDAQDPRANASGGGAASEGEVEVTHGSHNQSAVVSPGDLDREQSVLTWFNDQLQPTPRKSGIAGTETAAMAAAPTTSTQPHVTTPSHSDPASRQQQQQQPQGHDLSAGTVTPGPMPKRTYRREPSHAASRLEQPSPAAAAAAAAIAAAVAGMVDEPQEDAASRERTRARAAGAPPAARGGSRLAPGQARGGPLGEAVERGAGIGSGSGIDPRNMSGGKGSGDGLASALLLKGVSSRSAVNHQALHSTAAAAPAPAPPPILRQQLPSASNSLVSRAASMTSASQLLERVQRAGSRAGSCPSSPGPGPGPGAAPQAPQPDGVFVQMEDWKSLMQSLSRLVWLEGQFSGVLTQMDEHEHQIERLEAMLTAGQSGRDLQTSVLGLVAHDAPSAATGGAGNGRARRASGLMMMLGSPQPSSGSAGALGGAGGGSTPQGGPGGGNGNGAAAQQAGASKPALKSALSAKAKVQGAVRAIGMASRMRSLVSSRENSRKQLELGQAAGGSLEELPPSIPGAVPADAGWSAEGSPAGARSGSSASAGACWPAEVIAATAAAAADAGGVVAGAINSPVVGRTSLRAGSTTSAAGVRAASVQSSSSPRVGAGLQRSPEAGRVAPDITDGSSCANNSPRSPVRQGMASRAAL